MYPSFRYHKTEEPKLIESSKEEHKDWLHNPGMFLHEDHPDYVKKQEIKIDEKAKEEHQKPEAQEAPIQSEEIKEVKPKKKK